MNGVDYRTFLTVVNFVEEGYSRMNDDSDDISIPALVDYLRQSYLFS